MKLAVPLLACAFAALSAVSATARAASPPPAPMATPALPNRPLHVRLLVEVNRMGQVVGVSHGDLSGDRNFDLIAIGNALQMWIRRPNGTAESGEYAVTYQYDPKTHNVSRHPELLKASTTWADKPGAATRIIADARRQAEAIKAKLDEQQKQKEAESAKHLPDINAAVKRSMSTPSAPPKP